MKILYLYLILLIFLLISGLFFVIGIRKIQAGIHRLEEGVKILKRYFER